MIVRALVSKNRSNALLIQRSSRRFFVTAALLVAISVFVGFSRTYYLHRWFHKPDLSLFLHAHAAVMTSWIALFLIQTLLIPAGKTALHRKLGLLGMVSAALVPMFGASATIMAARREVLGHAPDIAIVSVVLALELTQMLMFAGFVAAGFSLRKRADVHKRLMLLGTLCMLPNAIVRIIRVPSFIIPLTIWSLCVALVVLIDWAVQRKLHPVFARWAVLGVVTLWLALAVGVSDVWQHLAQRAVDWKMI